MGDSEYAESGVDESGSEAARPSHSEISEVVDGKLHNLANAWELRFKSLKTDLSKGIKEDFKKISDFLVRSIQNIPLQANPSISAPRQAAVDCPMARDD